MSEFIKKIPLAKRQFLSLNLILEKPAAKGEGLETGPTAVVKLAESDRHQTQAISVHQYYKEI